VLVAYLIALIGSFIAGGINTLAGNGSAITLTILTEVLGLPPNMANGTNRVGILTQSAVASYIFWKDGKLELTGRSRGYLIWTTVGAIFGIYVATVVSNEAFATVFRYLLVLLLVVVLVKPKRWLHERVGAALLPAWAMAFLFLVLGFYAGFIQMGMGVFFLAVAVLIARYPIIEANALKMVVVGIATVLAVAGFAWRGLIDWQFGALLAVGQTTGAWLAARFATQHPRAGLWAYRVLIVVVIWAVLQVFGVFDGLLT
jgi:uncharacterized membrane protein YfcA